MSVRYEIDGPVAIVTLDRPEARNAVDALKAMGTPLQNRLDPAADAPMGPSWMLLAKPVIAAIEGHAVAGGLELALWCDLRVAADDAVLGIFCRRFGVPLMDGGTVRLPRLVGMSHAPPRPDPDRPQRRCRRGVAHGSREPPGGARPGSEPRRRRGPPGERLKAIPPPRFQPEFPKGLFFTWRANAISSCAASRTPRQPDSS